jgi:hypothetical protein
MSQRVCLHISIFFYFCGCKRAWDLLRQGPSVTWGEGKFNRLRIRVRVSLLYRFPSSSIRSLQQTMTRQVLVGRVFTCFYFYLFVLKAPFFKPSGMEGDFQSELLLFTFVLLHSKWLVGKCDRKIATTSTFSYFLLSSLLLNRNSSFHLWWWYDTNGQMLQTSYSALP